MEEKSKKFERDILNEEVYFVKFILYGFDAM